jgi:hypothetical protein
MQYTDMYVGGALFSLWQAFQKAGGDDAESCKR